MNRTYLFPKMLPDHALAYLYDLDVDERKHYNAVDHGFTADRQAPEGVPGTVSQAIRDATIALVAMAVTIASASLGLGITESIVTRTGIGGSLIGVITLGVASAMPSKSSSHQRFSGKGGR